jgi:hypothetical protein
MNVQGYLAVAARNPREVMTAWGDNLPPVRSLGRKRVGRPNKDFGHARLSRAVACIVKEREFGTAPHLTQPPSNIRWPGDIKASMDEYRRDVRELRRPTYEIDAVYPAVMTPVVGDDARERQPEPGVLVASRRSLAGADSHVRRLPCAPVAGGLLSYPRIGTGE